MKLSANPLVDAVDHVSTLMAVHSFDLRSAEIFIESNFRHVELWCSLLFPFGKLTLGDCFLVLLC